MSRKQYSTLLFLTYCFQEGRESGESGGGGEGERDEEGVGNLTRVTCPESSIRVARERESRKAYGTGQSTTNYVRSAGKEEGESKTKKNKRVISPYLSRKEVEWRGQKETISTIGRIRLLAPILVFAKPNLHPYGMELPHVAPISSHPTNIVMNTCVVSISGEKVVEQQQSGVVRQKKATTVGDTVEDRLPFLSSACLHVDSFHDHFTLSLSALIT
ncbi:hypothetical protein Fcan01_02746 [Folsomia candida]|uniref:Uncharacterized protein n=1 Tax=Folsomia candida TaxID=158441 RepID=A0A226F453_FOLCA|nr:hypothetical protein Fcan01_02746 [Folsomia candida]